MKEHYVSYECAVKLKELGFEGNGLKNYIRQGYYKFPNGYISPIKHDGDGILVQFRKENAERIPAPRLDQAAAWLREVKGIDIEINAYQHLDGESIKHQYNFGVLTINGETFANTWYNNYEKALSDAIDTALELLGKEVNNA